MTYDLPNNRKLIVDQDVTGGDSRSWDNLTLMIFGGGYQHLGDKHDIRFEREFNSRQEFIDEGEVEIRKKIKDVAICKAVHLYSHSGDSISTSYSYPYNCRWDSGTIGFVIVTKQAIRENWGVKRVTKELIKHADEILEGEIKTLNQELTGDVYCFRIEDENGDYEDGCCGFYGSDIQTNGILDNIGDEDSKFIMKNLEVIN